MRVDIRLFATLADRVEGATAATPFEIELAESSTVADLIERLHLPPEEVHLVIIDGRVVHDRATRLTGGSRVALFPPVGGG